MNTLKLTVFLFCLPTFACAGPFADGQKRAPRVAQAFADHGAAVKKQFLDAGAAWPPKGIFIRAFKADDVVELWAAPRKKGDPYRKVRDFPVCARSGVLGPKRQSGDFQVPEGFYFIDRFNPRSRFHLSLGINYPHVGDRARTPKGKSPGGDIFIHGDCVTIGCLPLKDGPMSALYVAAVSARDAGQRRIPVHIFPCRLDSPACWQKLHAEGDAVRMAYWKALLPGFEAFGKRQIPPRVTPLKDGGWRVRPAQ
jgi:murein L,D-transpeptidase YafK